MHPCTVSWRIQAKLHVLPVLAAFPSEKMSLSYLEQSGWRKRHKLHCSLQAGPYHPSGSSQCTAPTSCIMHRTWTGNLFHIWYYTCFNAILPNHPTLSLSHRVQKTVLSTVSVISALSQPLGSFWAISSCPPPFPRSIWDIFRPGSLIFWFHILLSFCTIPDFPMASILEWFASPSSSGSRFVRTVYYEIGMCSCKPINTNYYRQPPNTEREA